MKKIEIKLLENDKLIESKIVFKEKGFDITTNDNRILKINYEDIERYKCLDDKNMITIFMKDNFNLNIVSDSMILLKERIDNNCKNKKKKLEDIIIITTAIVITILGIIFFSNFNNGESTNQDNQDNQIDNNTNTKKILYKMSPEDAPYLEKDVLNYSYLDDEGNKISLLLEKKNTDCYYQYTEKGPGYLVVKNSTSCSFSVTKNNITIDIDASDIIGSYPGTPYETSYNITETITLKGTIDKTGKELKLTLDEDEYSPNNSNGKQFILLNPRYKRVKGDEYVYYNKDTHDIFNYYNKKIDQDFDEETGEFVDTYIKLSEYEIKEETLPIEPWTTN